MIYLASRERFHFCFMPDRTRHAGDTLEDARVDIDDTIEFIKSWPYQSDRMAYLGAFTILHQEAKGRRSPVGLLNDIVLIKGYEHTQTKIAEINCRRGLLTACGKEPHPQ